MVSIHLMMIAVGRLVHSIFESIFTIGNSFLWVWMHVNLLFRLFLHDISQTCTNISTTSDFLFLQELVSSPCNLWQVFLKLLLLHQMVFFLWVWFVFVEEHQRAWFLWLGQFGSESMIVVLSHSWCMSQWWLSGWFFPLLLHSINAGEGLKNQIIYLLANLTQELLLICIALTRICSSPTKL